MDFGELSGQVWGIFGGLFIFGIIYNYLIGRLERSGYLEGYTWLAVVIGTAVTLLAAIPLVGLEAVATVAALFAASGLPMALGNIARYVQARRRAEGR